MKFTQDQIEYLELVINLNDDECIQDVKDSIYGNVYGDVKGYVSGDVGNSRAAVIRKMYREKCKQVEKLERQRMDALNRCHHVITGETSPLDDILYIQEVLIADNKPN